MRVFCFFLLALLSGCDLLPRIGRAPLPEIFPYGEKPGLATPQAAGEPIDLALARGEFETVTIRLTGDPRGSLGKLRLQWRGEAEPGISVRAYWVGAHRLPSSSFRMLPPAGEVVDVLVPNEWLAEGKAKPPESHFPYTPTYLLEFRAPTAARPGSYEGTLEFHRGEHEMRLPIRLRVYQAQLPDTFSLAASFGFAPWETLKKHYGDWNSAEMELYKKYIDLALEHRIDLHKFYVKFPEPTAKDPLAEAAVPAQSFLGQTMPLLSDRGGSHRLKMTDLPVPQEQKQGKAEANRLFWQRLGASVKKHGLQDSTFVYFVDEPKPGDLKAIGENARRIRRWAPDLRLLVTHHHQPSLEGAFNIWCVNLFLWEKEGQPSPSFYRQRQKEKGEQLWFYVGCNSHGCTGAEDTGEPDLVMDRTSAYHRALPWVAFRYGAEGVLYYDTVYGYSHGGAESPWKDAFAFTGYGEGNLFYPCHKTLGGCSGQQALPSLRLKVIRDGLEDAEILRIGREKGLPVDDWVKALVPDARNFPRSAAPFEALKRKVLQSLEAQSKP